MEAYAYPVIGDRPVSEITSRDVVEILTPLWSTKPKTHIDVRQRISMVMSWAIANGYRTDNPVDAARLAFPANRRTPKKHHPSMPYEELPAFLCMLQAADSVMATNRLCIEFQILNASRPGEARGATWAEIDLDKAIWTIPAEKMKAGKEHRVPLSDRSIAILRDARNTSTPNLMGWCSAISKPIGSSPTTPQLTCSNAVACPTFRTGSGHRSAVGQWSSRASLGPLVSAPLPTS